MRNNLIVIVGPTAVGKTALSIALAKHFNAEIISSDAMQVYVGMDIGTGKITETEMENIPHYMLDIKQPNEDFSVAAFQREVTSHITEITDRNVLPILVGGSGLYINSVLYDYNFSQHKRDEAVTRELEERLEKIGNHALHSELEAIDPEQASKIHPNNYRRVVRALEVYKTTGQTMTERHKKQKSTPNYNHIVIGLEMDRMQLYEQINQRVDKMIEAGLVEEVKKLYDAGHEDTQALRAIGYKEIIPYLKGEASLVDCTKLLKQNSRKFAKRQFTWFKNQMDVDWFTIDQQAFSKTIENVINHLEENFFVK